MIYHDEKNVDVLGLVARKFQVDSKLITMYDFCNNFGGISSEFKCHIYDDLASLLKYESHAQLHRMKILPVKGTIRKPTRLEKQKRIKLQGAERGKAVSGMRVTYDVNKIKKEYL